MHPARLGQEPLEIHARLIERHSVPILYNLTVNFRVE
jgi:hypothetical protein